jgi:hypothetical protein
MKNILLFCMFLGLNACVSDKMIEGGEDTIHFSTRELSFTAQGGTSVVTSESTFWWISKIDYYTLSGLLNGNEEGIFEDSVSGISIEVKDRQIIAIEGPWYTVKRESDKTTLLFTIKPNDTGEARNLKLHVEAGDFFTWIGVDQAAE